ncbi:MAG: hypothetical protein Q8P18_32240 [Pseudomonadota bacterium]|nr:hypothetical protein [Pseudomonadota bacterium]
MKLHRPVLTALVLLVGLPAFAPQAMAWDIQPSIRSVGGKDAGHEGIGRIVFSVPDTSGTAAVTAELESDVGDEDLLLVETDAWLHGAATIAALPAADADLTLTLYDSGSASLISFSGTLGADGSITLTADETTSADSAACASRSGCAEEPTRADARDIELLAAELFAAERGYDLTVDLAGADTYGVAYATVTVTEPGEEVCVAEDADGNCLRWQSNEAASTRTEVYWHDIGSVWEAEATLAHEGLVQVKVKTYDAEGEKLETAKARLGAPWLDGGEGVNTLATDEDPLTRVGLVRRREFKAGIELRVVQTSRLTIVSEGWTAGDSLPVDAELELTNGETITIPVNSYQRPGHTPTQSEASLLFSLLDTAGRIVIDDGEGGDVAFDVESLEELSVPLCSEGFCVVVSETERGAYALSVSAYGPIATDLPDTVEVELTAFDAAGETLASEWVSVEFDDEITAVFANELSLAGDPAGLGLSGKVKLLGEPNRRGKQETLAKGKFYGTFSRDGDGDLELAGADKDAVVSSGDIVVGGEAVFLTDREGVPAAPPAVVSRTAGEPVMTMAQLNLYAPRRHQ